MTKVLINVEGVSLAEAVRAIGLLQFSTDELLKELQARGLGTTSVVAVQPTTAEEKRKPGRPPKLTTTTTAASEPPKAATPTGAADGDADPWDNEPAEEINNNAAEVTQEDVRAALDKCHKTCGLVTARQKMMEVGGSAKLVDIAPEKFGALVAALNKMVKDAEANKASKAA